MKLHVLGKALSIVAVVAAALLAATSNSQPAQADPSPTPPPAWAITNEEVLSITHDADDTQQDKDVIEVRISWTKPVTVVQPTLSIFVERSDTQEKVASALPTLANEETSGQTTVTLTVDSASGHSCDGYQGQASLIDQDPTPVTRATENLPAITHPANITHCQWNLGPHPTLSAGQGYWITHTLQGGIYDNVILTLQGTKAIGDQAYVKTSVASNLTGLSFDRTYDLGQATGVFNVDPLTQLFEFGENTTPAHTVTGYNAVAWLMKIRDKKDGTLGDTLTDEVKKTWWSNIPHPE